MPYDSHTNILPDVRTKNVTPKGSVRGPGGNWVPVHCANCGKSGGLVPEENCSFAFYLCTPCGAKWGNDAHFWVEPDTVFWDRVRDEQLEKHARILEPMELLKELEDPSSPLTKLLKERLAKGPL